MAKQSRHSTGVIQPTQSAGKPSPGRRELLLTSLLAMLVSLACAISSLAASDPLFIAPQGIPRTGAPPPQSLASGEADTPPTAVPSPQVLAQAFESDPTPAPVEEAIPTALPFMYTTQAGDTLPVLAVRFGVDASEIQTASPATLPETSLLNPGQLLLIPNRLADTTPSALLMPDSEVVFSPSAADFDVRAFADQAGGYLSTYWQYLASTGMTRGPDVVQRVALENSINPRLLLALLEYQSGWVYGQPETQAQADYPLGRVDVRYKGLYQQLAFAVNQVSIGYYDWREGRLVEIRTRDGVTTRLAPELNAGTAALQTYFAQHKDSLSWSQALDPQSGFPALYWQMYGDPWVRAQSAEPLYPADLEQPPLILPFMLNQLWAFTGGPHGAWDQDGAWAAVDFAPGSLEPGCVKSDAWAVAAAAGLVVRSDNAVVAIDLDGDGREQTGWVLVYLHVAKDGRIRPGEWVDAGDPIGHPSCEGGRSTGTHIHLARKYNGEWIPADGPLPFVMSGWRVHAGEKPYDGKMTRDGQTIIASTLSPSTSRVIRRLNDP
jgi:LasA protease